ncbi:hypothetical protein [Streptomyces sp. NBRC 109706]|uniref:DUF7848 domain-containing protein n=1 Tax=Streptomyces sp. NBRC 109706 TaxID=1550035 RepID=UPI0007819EAA|nr:hypothetical protein [Streptomyces sp. NBRC 109706]
MVTAYSLLPDEFPGAEPVRCFMECRSCGVCGSVGEDGLDGAEWAASHLERHPDHLAYREHTTRPYRFQPGETS